jgi:hypothetical protein
MSLISPRDANRLNSQAYQQKLRSISKPSWFNRYLIVESKNDGVSLSQTNLLKVLWEKFTGLIGARFGCCDMTNKKLVELVTINFLEKNQEYITEKDINLISQLAQRAGLQLGIGTRAGMALHLINADEANKQHNEQTFIIKRPI